MDEKEMLEKEVGSCSEESQQVECFQQDQTTENETSDLSLQDVESLVSKLAEKDISKMSKTKMTVEFLKILTEEQGVKISREELRKIAKNLHLIDKIDDNGNVKHEHKISLKEKMKRKKKRKMEKKARKRNRG